MDNKKDKNQPLNADDDLKQTQDDIMRLKKRLEAQRKAASTTDQNTASGKQGNDLEQNVYDDEYYARTESQPGSGEESAPQQKQKSGSSGWLSESSMWESTMGLRENESDEADLFEDAFTGRVAETSQVPATPEDYKPEATHDKIQKSNSPEPKKPAPVVHNKAPSKAKPVPTQPTKAPSPKAQPRTPAPAAPPAAKAPPVITPVEPPVSAPKPKAKAKPRIQAPVIPDIDDIPVPRPGQRSVFEAKPVGMSGPISETIGSDYSASQAKLKAHPGLKKVAQLRLVKTIAWRSGITLLVLAAISVVSIYFGLHHQLPLGKNTVASFTKLQKSMGSDYGLKKKKAVKKAAARTSGKTYRKPNLPASTPGLSATEAVVTDPAKPAVTMPNETNIPVNIDTSSEQSSNSAEMGLKPGESLNPTPAETAPTVTLGSPEQTETTSIEAVAVDEAPEE